MSMDETLRMALRAKAHRYASERATGRERDALMAAYLAGAYAHAEAVRS